MSIEDAEIAQTVEGLPKHIEAVRTEAANEYHDHLKGIETMSEHTANEKWVSFRTGFKYGYLASGLDASAQNRELQERVEKLEKENETLHAVAADVNSMTHGQ